MQNNCNTVNTVSDISNMNYVLRKGREKKQFISTEVTEEGLPGEIPSGPYLERSKQQIVIPSRHDNAQKYESFSLV